MGLTAGRREGDSRPELRTDVLVVGAGPAGLTLSALLARAGVSAITVTKHHGTAHTPRAHITNQRTMEVLRDLGVEAEARQAGDSFTSAMPNIVWMTSFAGREIARVRARGAGPDRLSDYALASPCRPWNVPQDRLEPLLLKAAQRVDADIRFGHELVNLEQRQDGVAATVIDRRSGRAMAVNARWLIGADGGASTVAPLAGFALEGQLNVRRAVNVWADVDLTEYCARRPANIYGVHQPGRDSWMGAGLWVCVSPWTEWVVSRFIDAGDDGAGVTREQAEQWLRECVGADVAIEIRDIGTWAIHDAVATEYRRGRVLLVGDAAHRHPPVNGLGTNTSIQDAYNLAWKLALVTSGQARESLLDSYEAERRPVGQQVVRRSWTSARNSERLGAAIGLMPGQTVAEGEAKLAELASAGAAGRRRRAELWEALQATSFQFNAQGVELGQRYASGAVIEGGDPVSAAPPRDPELYYTPTTTPGACLPHAWLEFKGHPISTLDVPKPVGFTLIVGVEGDDWIHAARAVEGELEVPIRPAAIGYRLTYDDVYGDWQSLREVDDDGCLLVRPDRFIAWRSPAGVDDATAMLRSVVHRILGRR